MYILALRDDLAGRYSWVKYGSFGFYGYVEALDQEEILPPSAFEVKPFSEFLNMLRGEIKTEVKQALNERGESYIKKLAEDLADLAANDDDKPDKVSKP